MANIRAKIKCRDGDKCKLHKEGKCQYDHTPSKEEEWYKHKNTRQSVPPDWQEKVPNQEIKNKPNEKETKKTEKMRIKMRIKIQK